MFLFHLSVSNGISMNKLASWYLPLIYSSISKLEIPPVDSMASDKSTKCESLIVIPVSPWHRANIFAFYKRVKRFEHHFLQKQFTSYGNSTEFNCLPGITISLVKSHPIAFYLIREAVIIVNRSIFWNYAHCNTLLKSSQSNSQKKPSLWALL